MNKLPANKESFSKVIEFGKQILEICDRLGIAPIIYGSLAYFVHTEDTSLPVRDIDMLVPESMFPALVGYLKKMKGIRYEQMPYNSVEVFNDELEVDLDSIEHYLDPRSRNTIQAEIGGRTFHILNREALADIYKEALDDMPNESHLDEKRSTYQKKLNNLKNI